MLRMVNKIKSKATCYRPYIQDSTGTKRELVLD